MIWLFVHALLLSTVAIAAWLAPDPVVWLGPAAAIEAVIAFAWLTAIAGVPARRLANLITAIRVLAAVTILAGSRFMGAWTLFAVAAIGLVTDLIDGAVARRLGPTAFGAQLDMETDALFILALAWAAAGRGIPHWVIAAGLARYAFAVPFLLLPDRSFPRAFSIFAKWACAVAAILLVAALYPATLIPATVAAAVAVGLLIVSFGWEALLRISSPVTGRHDRKSVSARGMLSSIVTYYGVPFRTFRLRRFYRQFVGRGSLVIDVGAHVGNKTRAFRGIGARVVAVEPQPDFARLLNRLYATDEGIHIVGAALGSASSTATIRVPPGHPTLATLNPDWEASIQEHFGDLEIEWDQELSVPVTTLNALIEEYGMPDFVKIDVEGYEAQVLEGLSHPVPALSFEYLPAHVDSALEALDLVEALGRYEYNYTRVEGARFVLDSWANAATIRTSLSAMAPTERSGDVYARLIPDSAAGTP